MIFRWWQWKFLKRPVVWLGIALYLVAVFVTFRSPEIKQNWLFSATLITPLLIVGLLFVPFGLLFVSLWAHFQATALIARLCNFEVVRVQILQIWCGGSCRSPLESPPIGFSGYFGYVSLLPKSPEHYRRRLMYAELGGVAATLALLFLALAVTSGAKDKTASGWLVLFVIAPLLRSFFYSGDTALSSASEPSLMAKAIVDAYTSGYPISKCPSWMYELAIQPQLHEEVRRWVARYYAGILSYEGKYSEASAVAKLLPPTEEQFDKELIAFLDFIQGGSELGMSLATEAYDADTTFYGYINRAFYAYYSGDRTEAHYRLRDMQNGYYRYQMDLGDSYEREFKLINLARKVMNLPDHKVHARDGVLAGGENAGP